MIERIIAGALQRGVAPFLFITGLVLGVVALAFMPREEEPQIVVPMIDVYVEAPGLSASEVERQVVVPVEKLLSQIPGIEHVYSQSHPNRALVTLAFYVGQDREDSLLNTYNKLYANQDQVPPVVTSWQVRPVEVDDVPIVVYALASSQPEIIGDFELRRLADEVASVLQSVQETSEVKVVGGRERAVQILFDPLRLAARQTTVLDVVNAIALSNEVISAGTMSYGNQTIALESGDLLRSLDALKSLVVNVVAGDLVTLGDVAAIKDGPPSTTSITWFESAETLNGDVQPMVAISIAKQRGTNAVKVAEQLHSTMAELQRELIPEQVQVQTIRDYGVTANEKVTNLGGSLIFAVLTVVAFIGLFLGWRAAVIVALAVPVCYGMTLALDLVFDYTINRVTLFALILSLGLLVDDPITGVDNITRKLQDGRGSVSERIVAAIAEIKVPLLMSTVTIVLAFLPLAFITGMMGPYMAPMAFNVPLAVVASTLTAFFVTPWLARVFLGNVQLAEADEDWRSVNHNSFYARNMLALLTSTSRRRAVLWLLLISFLTAVLLPVFRLVPLKLLPFDNKNELQIVIDMPEGTALEATAAVASEASRIALSLPEVSSASVFIGQPSPHDFNGLVRKHYLRQGPHMGDVRLTLVDKGARAHQSHALVLRLREALTSLNDKHSEAIISVVEVPPGPPVMATLVAEVYGRTLTPYAEQQRAAELLADRFRAEPYVIQVDTTVGSAAPRLRFVTDKAKAAMSGIPTSDINTTLSLAHAGQVVGFMAAEREAQPLPLLMRLPVAERSRVEDLSTLLLKGRLGAVSEQRSAGLQAAPQNLVALGELGQFESVPLETPIYRKDLRPVVYVTAEISGRTPAEVIADITADQTDGAIEVSNWQDRTFISSGGTQAWQVPESVDIHWIGEGEWKITVDVFRDMGLAFAFALVAIYFVLRLQTGSVALTLLIMSSIPLTMIGIMPGFLLLNQFGERWVAGAPEPVLFTATAMIGMIALAGLVVRNSLILVDFINQAREQGASVLDAVLSAGAVRMRPVLLTAGTTLLGNLVITLDPVFSGLAIAIIFGIVASTILTLVVVPVVYCMLYPTESDDSPKEIRHEQ